jgi:hypothetical protein
MLKLLIYPKWSNAIFSNGKTPNFTYSIRDTWFLKDVDYSKKFIEITDSYFSKIHDESISRMYRKNIKTYSKVYKID